jgi:hypothetical protein
VKYTPQLINRNDLLNKNKKLSVVAIDFCGMEASSGPPAGALTKVKGGLKKNGVSVVIRA